MNVYEASQEYRAILMARLTQHYAREAIKATERERVTAAVAAQNAAYLAAMDIRSASNDA